MFGSSGGPKQHKGIQRIQKTPVNPFSRLPVCNSFVQQEGTQQTNGAKSENMGSLKTESDACFELELRVSTPIHPN